MYPLDIVNWLFLMIRAAEGSWRCSYMDLECNEFDSYIRGYIISCIPRYLDPSGWRKFTPPKRTRQFSRFICSCCAERGPNCWPCAFQHIISYFTVLEKPERAIKVLQKLLVIKSTEGLDIAWKSPVPTSSMAQDFTFID